MSTNVIAIVVSLLLSLLCCGGSFFFFVLILGFVLLRRRGKKTITVQDAVKTGAVSVSQVFVRAKGGLEAMDDEDDDK